MSRLFIDCDDSLVFWIDLPSTELGSGTWRGDRYKINTDLISLIEKWQNKKLGLIVVWSDGGIEYAEYWKNKLLKHIISAVVLEKTLSLPTEKDIVVDDIVDLKTNGVLINPKQLTPLKELIEKK